MARKKTDPIQEQLIQARREQILAAATRVFAEKGFQRATIHDVAQAAGIADGTIYIYFENKTALLLGILNRVNETDRRDDDISQAVEMDVRKFVRQYVQQRFTVLTETGLDVMQVVLSEALVNPELRALYMQQIVEPTFALAEPYFAHLVKEGKIRPLDVPLTMRLISAMFLGTLLLRIMGDAELEDRWNELPDELIALMLDGVMPDVKGDSNEPDHPR